MLRLSEGTHRISFAVMEGGLRSEISEHDIRNDATAPQITLLDYDTDTIETTKEPIILNDAVDEDTFRLTVKI